MKQLLILLSVIALISCGKSDTDPIADKIEDKPTYLNVQNKQSYGGDILSVRLVGYDFENLAIARGKSQTFILDKGMPSGYNNINIAIGYRHPTGRIKTVNKSYNLKKGEVNTITLE